MDNMLLTINPEKEKQKIITFLKQVFEKQNVKNAVIGLSGGIDSTTSFYLLKEVLPPQNIYVTHLYYFHSYFKTIKKFVDDASIPKQNIFEFSIEKPINE